MDYLEDRELIDFSKLKKEIKKKEVIILNLESFLQDNLIDFSFLD